MRTGGRPGALAPPGRRPARLRVRRSSRCGSPVKALGGVVVTRDAQAGAATGMAAPAPLSGRRGRGGPPSHRLGANAEASPVLAPRAVRRGTAGSLADARARA
ncbi:hypothetical protein PSP6_130035 [Paraburkholderia tropica]|nr:hypothetical protein PSP6_130035 [Paraburkholderia tropica]